MRNRFFPAVAVILGALSVNLAWGQANPNNPNAQIIQGPGPSGNEGYPINVSPAVGSGNFPVAIMAGGGGAVTQGTSPWIVGQDAGSNPWIVGFNGVGQPVTQSGAWTVAVNNFPALFGVTQGTSPWVISGTVAQGAAGASAWKVDGSAVTQPVSGTFWQATQPVSGTVASTESGTWNVGLSTGSNTVGKVDQGIGGVSAWKVDGSAVTQPVSGTFWQATQPVSGTVTANQGGTWTVQPGNTANTTAWKVDGSAVTQPVSGTVTVNQGTNPWQVTPNIVMVSASYTRPADTTAYASGDVFSNSTSAPVNLTFSNCARSTGGGGKIIGVMITDSANQTTRPAFDLVLFDTNPAATNDNAVWAASDSDINNVTAMLGVAATASWSAGNATSGAGGNIFTSVVQAGTSAAASGYIGGVQVPFKTNASANLFGVLVVRNAYTPVSGEIVQIRLYIAQD